MTSLRYRKTRYIAWKSSFLAFVWVPTSAHLPEQMWRYDSKKNPTPLFEDMRKKRKQGGITHEDDTSKVTYTHIPLLWEVPNQEIQVLKNPNKKF